MKGKENKLVICFCKQPIPGNVKSRIARFVGNDEAAEIYKKLLSNVVENTFDKNKAEYSYTLYCSPDDKHPYLTDLKAFYNLDSKNQTGNDVGEKMFQALDDCLVQYHQVVLIGSDCPELNQSYINQAFSLLNTGIDIVLGPTADGGYALIGANKISNEIFQEINWSTEEVLEQTIQKLEKINYNYSLLTEVRDVDTIEDYLYFTDHKNFIQLRTDL